MAEAYFHPIQNAPNLRKVAHTASDEQCWQYRVEQRNLGAHAPKCFNPHECEWENDGEECLIEGCHER